MEAINRLIMLFMKLKVYKRNHLKLKLIYLMKQKLPCNVQVSSHKRIPSRSSQDLHEHSLPIRHVVLAFKCFVHILNNSNVKHVFFGIFLYYTTIYCGFIIINSTQVNFIAIIYLYG
ncbi:unnamed protein product [Cuscuta europaea]|uniref:Uncharacterized protein n=2 Tax=Cuscuta europaea TaxID=41803 RepID=A0A9P0ZJQ7_CUSEU|nr:unnamed protein product [Cuscuta europaea]